MNIKWKIIIIILIFILAVIFIPTIYAVANVLCGTPIWADILGKQNSQINIIFFY